MVEQARWGTDFWTKFKGFMFRQSIAAEEALVFVYRRDNRINTSIHMFFVQFPLGVVWVNKQGVVVDLVEAQPWRPSYAPKDPASYVIELHPDKLKHIQVGDQLLFT